MSLTSESTEECRTNLLPGPPGWCSERNRNSSSRACPVAPTFQSVPADLTRLLDDPVFVLWATEVAERYRISEIQALRTLGQALLMDNS